MGKAGWLSLGGGAFSIFTRKSNHAACPVIGSELAHRKPSPLGGSSSWIRWLSRNPLVASGACSSRAQAPLRLPIAFHVQTVFSFNAAISITGTVILPWTELTFAHSPSIKLFSCINLLGKYSGFIPWICLNQAFCVPQL